MRPRPTQLPLLALLLLPVPTRATITYLSLHHADDILGQSATAHDESNAPGTVTATLPGLGTATSTLLATDSILSFTVTHIRTDVDRPMAHTLFTANFSSDADMTFTFDGGYTVTGLPTPPGAPDPTYVAFDAGYSGNGETLESDHYGRILLPATFAFPTPADATLHAGQSYSLVLEIANETYPYFDGGTTATAHVTLTFSPLVPEPVLVLPVVALGLARPRRHP